MRFLRFALAAVSFGFIALGAACPASAQAPYSTLSEAQPTDSGGKVEVIEFFSYACSHCNDLDPVLAQWVKQQGDNIAFKRVPVGFRADLVPLQKLYYALESIGKIEELHSTIFNAMYVERQPLGTDDQVLAFVVKNGVDKRKFTEAYGSSTVEAKLRRARQLQESFNINKVPSIAVDGRYLTSPSKVGENFRRDTPESVLQAAIVLVMDHLVVKSRTK